MYLVTCHGLEYRPDGTEPASARSLYLHLPGKRRWSSPWAQEGHHVQSMPDSSFKEERNWTTWYGKLVTALSHGRWQCSASGLLVTCGSRGKVTAAHRVCSAEPELCGGEWWPQAWHCSWKRARNLTVQLRRDMTVSHFQTRGQHFSFITFWKFYLEVTGKLTEKLLYESLSREVLFLPST